MNKMKCAWKLSVMQLKTDRMTAFVLVASCLLAAAVKFGVPRLMETLPWLRAAASLIDIFVIMLVPFLLCFTSAMVMLEELDDGVARYYSIMPTGRAGYLLGRLGIPCGIAALLAFLIAGFCTLQPRSLAESCALAALTSLQALITSLIITGFGKNKLEGMAVAKLSALMMSGLFVPYVLIGPQQYLFALLPAFWLAKAVLDRCALFWLVCFFLSLAWVLLLWRRLTAKTT